MVKVTDKQLEMRISIWGEVKLYYVDEDKWDENVFTELSYEKALKHAKESGKHVQLYSNNVMIREINA